jgi:hypothetical protein
MSEPQVYKNKSNRQIVKVGSLIHIDISDSFVAERAEKLCNRWLNLKLQEQNKHNYSTYLTEGDRDVAELSEKSFIKKKLLHQKPGWDPGSFPTEPSPKNCFLHVFTRRMCMGAGGKHYDFHFTNRFAIVDSIVPQDYAKEDIISAIVIGVTKERHSDYDILHLTMQSDTDNNIVYARRYHVQSVLQENNREKRKQKQFMRP